MSQPQFGAESCQETAGFLFSHPCGETAVFTCSDCQKKVCQRHAIDHGGQLRCVACMKNQRAQGNASEIGSPYGAYPPFFYAEHYGYGYGYGRSRYGWTTSHNQHDFTDSDEKSLSGEEVDAEGVASYEDNLGAS